MVKALYGRSDKKRLSMSNICICKKSSGQLPSDLSRGDLDVSLNQNLSPVFTTSASFKKTVHSSGKSAVKPSLTVHRRGAKILEANGKKSVSYIYFSQTPLQTHPRHTLYYINYVYIRVCICILYESFNFLFPDSIFCLSIKTLLQNMNSSLFGLTGELEITPSSDIEDHSDFNGKGQFHYNGKKSYFSLDGIHNITSFAINLQCDFWNGETLKWSSVQKKLQGKDESGRGGGGGGWLHSQMTLELSESPQYNTVASWKYQVNDER